MSYCNWMDKLPNVAKILIAIFPPILYVIYRIIKDCKNITLLLLDILLGIAPVPFVFWIMNLIYVISKGTVFSFAEWVGDKDVISADEKKSADDKKADDKTNTADKK